MEQDEEAIIPPDDIIDIVTNYMACQSSLAKVDWNEVELFLKKYCGDIPDDKKHYEYFFNLSQINLNAHDVKEAVQNLKIAFEKAKTDESYKDDIARFKVQEMHLINQLFNQFSQIQYSAPEEGAWFEFPKTIKNNILVELNINALSEVYDLNQHIFKEAIGSLNWKKFAERIKTQLKDNQLLTQNQKDMLQINAIISLVKSNTIDEARNMLK